MEYTAGNKVTPPPCLGCGNTGCTCYKLHWIKEVEGE